MRDEGRKALRTLALAFGCPSIDTAPTGSRLYEAAVVAAFYARANRQGLPLPALTNEHHQILISAPRGLLTDSFGRLGLENNIWPPRELWSLFALAQHYGVPTRMLDWSCEAYVAAYFAAHCAIRQREEAQASDVGEKRINVWWTSLEVSIALSALRPAISHQDVDPAPGHGGIVSLVDVPYPGNDYLAAQLGRFTLTNVHRSSKVLNENYSYKEVLALSREFKSLLPRNQVLLKQFSLGESQAENLLIGLGREGYDSSRLFPGFAGWDRVVKDVTLFKTAVR